MHKVTKVPVLSDKGSLRQSKKNLHRGGSIFFRLPLPTAATFVVHVHVKLKQINHAKFQS